MLDRFLDAGGNFVDTADVYADGRVRADPRHGARLPARRRRARDQGAVRDRPRARTMSVLSPAHIRDAVEASLRRLRTDRIDLYQIHCWDPRTPLEETVSTLDDLVREGKVRYVGASNYAGWQLAEGARRRRAARLGAVRVASSPSTR